MYIKLGFLNLYASEYRRNAAIRIDFLEGGVLSKVCVGYYKRISKFKMPIKITIAAFRN